MSSLPPVGHRPHVWLTADTCPIKFHSQGMSYENSPLCPILPLLCLRAPLSGIFSSLSSSLYFNELSSEGRQALRDLGGTAKGGARVVVSLTEGTAVSEYWSVILSEVQRNLNSWDRGRVRRHLDLLLRDLEDSRGATLNPWRKAQLLRVEGEVRVLLEQLGGSGT